MWAHLVLALSLVALHRLDGGVVLVNPRNVTSLHNPRPPGANSLLSREGHCAIWMSDGRLVSVLEPCAEVQRMLEAGGQ